MKRFFSVAAAVFSVTAIATPAAAQSNICGKRDSIVERLQDKYGETRQSMGLQQNNGVLEVFASEASGSWTILVTMPNGMTCLVAAGDAWEANADLAKTPGKGA